MTYQGALKSRHERRVVLTPCVEGRSVRIELRRGEYRGYWESRGRGNQAEAKR